MSHHDVKQVRRLMCVLMCGDVFFVLHSRQLVEGARVTGCRLRDFDEEHAVVHRATESAKTAWLGFKQVRS